MRNRKEKEDALNRRMARWARMGWWEADFTEKSIACSESLSTELGILDQGCVMSFDELSEKIHPDQRQVVMREFEELSNSDSYDVVCRLLTQDGYQWGHSRCALREVHPDGRIVVFGTWQKVNTPADDELKLARQRINSLLYHQMTVSSSLSKFIKSGNLERAVHNVLDDVRRYFKADRVFVIEYLSGESHLDRSYEVGASGTGSHTRVSGDSLAFSSYWVNTLLAGNNVVVDSLETMPAEAADLKVLLEQRGVKSHLAISIQDADGKVAGFMGIDVTGTPRHWAPEDSQWLLMLATLLNLFEELERSRAEAVRERNLLENLFGNLPVGVELYDKDGLLADVNNRCMELFGMKDKHHLLGLDLMKEPNLSEEQKARIRTDPVVDVHMDYDLKLAADYLGKTGEGVLNLFAKYCHLHDSNGQFCGYMVIYVDITEQMNQQIRLKEVNNLFSLVAEYAKVGYAKLNLLTGQRYAIRQWYKNLGVPFDADTLSWQEMYRNVHPDDHRRIMEFAEAVRRREKSRFSSVLRVRSEEENREWNYLQCNIIVNRYAPEEHVIELISINYDITGMKLLEAELKEAKERAETSERLKSAFLANMSHEIRTPLNAIVGFSSLLASDDCPTEMRDECYEMVEKNNELLQQLISDVLDLAKIESGTMEFRYREISANDLCNSVVSNLRTKTQPGVELLFAPAEQDCCFTSDFNRLSQVLNNFVSNAVKFTSKGHIRIGFVRKADDRLRFYVEDTGIGIAADMQGKIFERFVQLNDNIQGTGLGLRICSEIVHRLGGTIGVDSQLGEGSCFWFELPNENEETI